MNPKVSIIVPVYKVPEKYIRQCVDSLTNQTYKDIEIILVDDGCPDGGGNMCDAIALEDSRIRTIHKTNGGLVSARNAGYREAKGEWFFFMDSDDWVDTDMLEKIFKQLDSCPNVDVAFWKIVDEINGKPVYGKWSLPIKDYTRVFEEDECKELAVKTLSYKYGVASPVIRMVRRSFAKEYCVEHDDRTKQGMEGLIFAMRSFYYAKKVLLVNEYFYHYRYNMTSISKTVSESNVKCITDCFMVVLEDIEKFTNKAEFKLPLLQKAVYSIIAFAMNTYFQPNNKEGLCTRIRKFKNAINEFPLYKEAIEKASTHDMDKNRKLALYMIRCHFYAGLDVMGKLKQYMLKKGKSNY